ncbi:MAG: hypothetical protein IGS23_14370 [Rivularia sp. T60_A2020_040]|nr:hypothetical protein [Rivularia sp. T60_A2020_040]
MTSPFNQSLYEASLKALTSNGVPEEIAHKASEVVASDDASKPDLGRTQQDREAINEAMNYYWEHERKQH